MTDKDELLQMLYLLLRSVTGALDKDGNVMKNLTLLNDISPSSAIFVLEKTIEFLEDAK